MSTHRAGRGEQPAGRFLTQRPRDLADEHRPAEEKRRLAEEKRRLAEESSPAPPTARRGRRRREGPAEERPASPTRRMRAADPDPGRDAGTRPPEIPAQLERARPLPPLRTPAEAQAQISTEVDGYRLRAILLSALGLVLLAILLLRPGRLAALLAQPGAALVLGLAGGMLLLAGPVVWVIGRLLYDRALEELGTRVLRDGVRCDVLPGAPGARILVAADLSSLRATRLHAALLGCPAADGELLTSQELLGPGAEGAFVAPAATRGADGLWALVLPAMTPADPHRPFCDARVLPLVPDPRVSGWDRL
ncbi:hypothetical protein [Brachybacterium hainanense]|uniref:Uncharacterized protein n=1 Tax=Brachybacterium hainanense TaxID=1541174 RepID=A0ABV6RA69_9MICO